MEEVTVLRLYYMIINWERKMLFVVKKCESPSKQSYWATGFAVLNIKYIVLLAVSEWCRKPKLVYIAKSTLCFLTTIRVSKNYTTDPIFRLIWVYSLVSVSGLLTNIKMANHYQALFSRKGSKSMCETLVILINKSV